MALGRYHVPMRRLRIWFGISVLIVEGCGGGKPPVIVRTGPVIGPGYARTTAFQPTTHPGAMEMGMKGDWVLENDQMRVVVSGAGLRRDGGEHDGNILDAVPQGGEDLLREVIPFFVPNSGRHAWYTSVAAGPGASLIARGKDSENGTLKVTTTYSLAPKATFVGIQTSVVNTGAKPVRELQLGDGIQWGRASPYGPGIGRELAGQRPLLPFLLGFGDGTAYAWVSQEADLTGQYGESWSAPVIRTVDLAPGDSVVYTRKLYVATSTAFVSTEAYADRSITNLGMVRLTVEGHDGHLVRGGRLDIRKPDGSPILGGDVLPAPTDWMLPAGEAVFEVHHPERGRAASVKVMVTPGKPREVTLHLPDPCTVVLKALDYNGRPSPARWTFEGVGDTPTPDFGPRYDIGGAGSYHFTPTGTARVQVPAGRYRVTATRGPGYQAWRGEVSLLAGKETGLEARLVRLEIPPAWVEADLNVHALPTEDAPIGLEERAAELACEGIEWFVSGDPWSRTNYASVLDTMKVAAPLRAVVGEEITTRVGRFQAFPLPIHADTLGLRALEGEALLYENALSLGTLFDRLHSAGEEVLIQVDDPRSGGYFDTYGYTAKVDTARAGFRRDFDLMEVLSGKSNPEFPALWDDWMRLLGSDSPVTAVGNSDSRSLFGDEAGVPRNFVALEPSSETEPMAKFVEGLRLGRVVVSNGPFIDFTLGGIGVGGTLVSRGTILGHIRVVAPSWVDVKIVRVYVNGREDSSYLLRGRSRTLRFDEDIEVTINSPSFVVVRVEGNEPMDPVVTASGSFARPLPIAFTNPIWVKTEAGR